MLDHGINGAFDICGKIQCIETERTIFVGGKTIPKQLRDGILADESGHIPICVWYPFIAQVKEDQALKIHNVVLQSKYGIRFTTITTSAITSMEEEEIDIDWENIPSTKDLVSTKICCPDVVSVKCNAYKACVNFTCQKKSCAISWRTSGNLW